MGIHTKRTYLQKHRFSARQIHTPPPQNLGMVAVIPAYCEYNLTGTLSSIEACHHPFSKVEVIVVFNSGIHESDSIKDLNERILDEATIWRQQQQSGISYHFLSFLNLPKKHAGVGLARKIGMDEAVDRFEQIDKKNGVIVCLDADSTVAPNYFVAIEEHFSKYSQIQACSIFFEHPLRGESFSPDVYKGIIYYELFLRYYIEGLRYAGHPHAYHCVGSSMAVRSHAYQQQGGMNRRKAGEDFYFLQKFIQLDQLNELNLTTVYPSPRPAQKVPFGTGRAIQKWLEQENDSYLTYDFACFEDIKQFLAKVPSLYTEEQIDVPTSIDQFLRSENFYNKFLPEIRTHVSTPEAFIKRFFRWFNGLKVLQYIHFARDHWYPLVDIMEVAPILCSSTSVKIDSPRSYLEAYREMQRNR